MAAPSMQVCMETSDWLKAIISDDSTVTIENNSTNSSPSATAADLLARPNPPLLERRLRPPHEHPLNCPRCDSTHTKFCYYNNYSLSQPRYFCKTCRRYWTKGGSLRNVPVGGGCRKNKHRPHSSASKKDQESSIPTDLQLSNMNMNCFMFDSGLTNRVFTGNYWIDSVGLEHNNLLALPEEGNIAAADAKPANRMLSLEWPDLQGCSGGDSYGLWAGLMGGHGPSSAAM